VDVSFGGVNVHKVDQNWVSDKDTIAHAIPGGFEPGNIVPLASAAQYQLFASEADAVAGVNPIQGVAVANGITVFDAEQDNPAHWQVTDLFVADADGSAAMLGLSVKSGAAATCGFTGDLEDFPTMVTAPAAVATALMQGTLYWGLEVKAPAGYELQGAPFPVCVASYLDGDVVGTSYDDLHVVNVASDARFTLPLTGWNQVQSLIALVGTAFFALAIAFAVRQRRNITKASRA
jgi:LPXTG-motif cell wall-anchored protein